MSAKKKAELKMSPWSKWAQRNLKPGRKVRMYYGAGNFNNATFHIRAIVDDVRVVSRVWSKHKQGWRYQVDHFYTFELAFQAGHLKSA